MGGSKFSRLRRMAIGGAAGGVPVQMLTILDEGVALPANTTGIDFVGAGVTATGTGATKTVTIPGGSTSPGGSTTQVQYNDAGAFGGDAGMTYDAANNELLVRCALPGAGVRIVTGGTDTLLLTDNGGVVVYQDAGGTVCTIPGTTTLPVGFSCVIIQDDLADTVTFTGSGSITLNSFGGLLATGGPNAAVSVFFYDVDVVNIAGNLA